MFPLAEQRWTRAIHHQIPARGESPCACDLIALAPSITVWRVAYRELAKDLQSSAEPRQRGYPPIPVRSRWGDPTMPPHHVKVPSPRGWRGWGVEGGNEERAKKEGGENGYNR